MLLDVHTHIGSYRGAYLETALEEMRRQRIAAVSNCIDLPCHRRTVEISTRCSLVIPAFGIHPRYAADYVNKLEVIDQKVREALIIGEVGLDADLAKKSGNGDQQEQLFRFILDRAKKYEKMVILHTDGAEERVLELLEKYDLQRVIIHWYTGPINVYRRMVERGYGFSIGYMVLFSDFIRVIARRIPKEQLFLETDNPGAFEARCSRPGMPHLIDDVRREVARLRNQSHHEITQQNWENFMNLLTLGERREILARVRRPADMS